MNCITHTCRILLIILGGILCIDSLYLLMLGKIHIGIVLPLFLGSVLICIGLKWSSLHLFLQQHHKTKTLVCIGCGLFAVWLISLAYFATILHAQSNNQTTAPNVRAIIVLGSGTIHGKPTPTLALRLDRAAELAMQQPKTLLVLSGGLDFAAKQTEAAIMAKYLHEYYPSIALNRMILEDKSTSTELNLKNSALLLQQQQIEKTMPIAIVTSDFHTLRAHAIAQKQGYTQSVMLGAKTPLQTRYNAWLREYFAFISGKILQEY
ncbi:YdcF family protein [Acinetobacter sp. MD2(2019)]|uniref:YdcF family protein n=1 Tax=Acinetobacter sp. MD2(2019) TaxID=2605273 RepID=UPI002D1F773A|nr:YdcF family protein [Acinetobacter sp. MD2(2019)]MEB3753379.1 YdcF family protein [Acinetobacter sp. MD2(2019)]